MKTITKRQFRVLLALSILALLASMFATALNSWLLPQTLLDYMMSEHNTRPKVGDLVISLLAVPGVIAGIVSVVGLYRFWRHARGLNVAAWIYILVWMAVSSGPAIENVVGAAFSQLSTLLSGIVLGVAYFSPAAEWFEKRQDSAAT